MRLIFISLNITNLVEREPKGIVSTPEKRALQTDVKVVIKKLTEVRCGETVASFLCVCVCVCSCLIRLRRSTEPC